MYHQTIYTLMFYEEEEGIVKYCYFRIKWSLESDLLRKIIWQMLSFLTEGFSKSTQKHNYFMFSIISCIQFPMTTSLRVNFLIIFFKKCIFMPLERNPLEKQTYAYRVLEFANFESKIYLNKLVELPKDFSITPSFY